MRKLLWLIPLAMFFCAPSHAAITHVSGQSCATKGSGSVASVACTLPGNIAAGNLIYVCLSNFATTNLLTDITWSGDSGAFVTDTWNFTWSSFRTLCAHVLSAGGGGATITATDIGGVTYSNPVITVDEFAGGPFYLDRFNAGNVNATTSVTSLNITTILNGDLVIGQIAAGSTSTLVASGSFTLGGHYTGAAQAANVYEIQPSAGVIAVTGTLGSTVGSVATVASFSTSPSTPTQVIGQGCTSTVTSPSGTCVFPHAVQAGNQMWFCESGTALTSPTWSGDSATFASDLSNKVWNSTLHMYCWHVLSATGNAGTLTLTDATLSGQLVGAEFYDATGGLDQSDVGATGTSTGAFSSVSVNPQVNNELILGMIAATTSPTLGSGYTLAQANSGNLYKMEFQTQSTAASIAATGTTGGSVPWIAHIITMEPAGAVKNTGSYFPLMR